MDIKHVQRLHVGLLAIVSAVGLCVGSFVYLAVASAYDVPWLYWLAAVCSLLGVGMVLLFRGRIKEYVDHSRRPASWTSYMSVANQVSRLSAAFWLFCAIGVLGLIVGAIAWPWGIVLGAACFVVAYVARIAYLVYFYASLSSGTNADDSSTPEGL